MHSTINSTDFSITSDRDETVEGFHESHNRKLEYLPSNLGEKFPNLIILGADHCSVKEIAKENFKGLKKLRKLILNHNKIEKIDDDTIEYIPAVERIQLSKY